MVKRRSNMEHENMMWLLLLPDFKHFFDLKTNCSPKLSIKVFNVKRVLPIYVYAPKTKPFFFLSFTKIGSDL
jgi:hypothetical protein